MAVYLLPLPQRANSLRAGAVAGKIGITLLSIAGVGLALLGIAIGGSFGDLKEKRAVSQGAAAVEVGPTRAIREYGYVRVLGSARNLSRKPMQDVEAVVELLNGNGKLLNVESALVETSSIAAGEESPFSVHLRDATGATSYRVRFRTLLGPSLSQRYADR